MPSPSLRALTLLVLAAATGCGDDSSLGGDSGAPDAGTDGGVLVTPIPPAPPSLPDLSPCPTGWESSVTADGIPICEPLPPTGDLDACTGDEAHVPGTSGCAPVGAACPPGGFSDSLPAGRPALYVQAGAAGGDGSMTAPFGRIAEATAVASAGSVIALATGEYVEEVSLPAGVALVGACASGTTIRFDAARLDRGVVNADGPDVEISDLTITSSPRPGLWVVGDGVSATVRSVVVDGAQLAGISVESGAHLDAERVIVRNTTTPALLAIGRGLNVESGATADVRQLDSRNNVEFSVIANTGASLTLTDSSLAETLPPSAGDNGGHGLGIFGGASVTGRRLALLDNAQASIVAFEEGSTAELEDVVIRRVLPRGPFFTGRGINIETGSSLRCSRCLIEEAMEVAAAVGSEAVLALVDVLMRDTLPRPDGSTGRGMTVQFGGVSDLSRVAIVDGVEHGILVDGDGSSLTAEDLVIHRIEHQADGWMGRAISMQHGGRASVVRASFRELHDMGILVAADSEGVFEDLELADVHPRDDGHLGRGINVQNGGLIEVSRARIESVHQVGVNLLAAPTRAVLRDLVVSNVAPQPCGSGSCLAFPGGDGLGAHVGAILDAETFVIEDARLCGLLVSNDGVLILERGLVQRSQIGACVQSDAQDLAALSRTVHYIDNESNLEATELPIPDTAELTE